MARSTIQSSMVRTKRTATIVRDDNASSGTNQDGDSRTSTALEPPPAKGQYMYLPPDQKEALSEIANAVRAKHVAERTTVKWSEVAVEFNTRFRTQYTSTRLSNYHRKQVHPTKSAKYRKEKTPPQSPDPKQDVKRRKTDPASNAEPSEVNCNVKPSDVPEDICAQRLDDIIRCIEMMHATSYAKSTPTRPEALVPSARMKVVAKLRTSSSVRNVKAPPNVPHADSSTPQAQLSKTIKELEATIDSMTTKMCQLRRELLSTQEKYGATYRRNSELETRVTHMSRELLGQKNSTTGIMEQLKQEIKNQFDEKTQVKDDMKRVQQQLDQAYSDLARSRDHLLLVVATKFIELEGMCFQTCQAFKVPLNTKSFMDSICKLLDHFHHNRHNSDAYMELYTTLKDIISDARFVANLRNRVLHFQEFALSFTNEDVSKFLKSHRIMSGWFDFARQRSNSVVWS
jgi:hypothetical protein